jgi:hypothetical protein
MSAVSPSTPISVLIERLLVRLVAEFPLVPRDAVGQCVADARISAKTTESAAAYLAAVEDMARAELATLGLIEQRRP